MSTNSPFSEHDQAMKGLNKPQEGAINNNDANNQNPPSNAMPSPPTATPQNANDKKPAANNKGGMPTVQNVQKTQNTQKSELEGKNNSDASHNKNSQQSNNKDTSFSDFLKNNSNISDLHAEFRRLCLGKAALCDRYTVLKKLYEEANKKHPDHSHTKTWKSSLDEYEAALMDLIKKEKPRPFWSLSGYLYNASIVKLMKGFNNQEDTDYKARLKRFSFNKYCSWLCIIVIFCAITIPSYTFFSICRSDAQEFAKIEELYNAWNSEDYESGLMDLMDYKEYAALVSKRKAENQSNGKSENNMVPPQNGTLKHLKGAEAWIKELANFHPKLFHKKYEKASNRFKEKITEIVNHENEEFLVKIPISDGEGFPIYQRRAEVNISLIGDIGKLKKEDMFSSFKDFDKLDESLQKAKKELNMERENYRKNL